MNARDTLPRSPKLRHQIAVILSDLTPERALLRKKDGLLPVYLFWAFSGSHFNPIGARANNNEMSVGLRCYKIGITAGVGPGKPSWGGLEPAVGDARVPSELVRLVKNLGVKDAFDEAVKARPGRIVTLRQKARLLADSRNREVPRCASGASPTLRAFHRFSFETRFDRASRHDRVGFFVRRTTAALTDKIGLGIVSRRDEEGVANGRSGCQAIPRNAVNTLNIVASLRGWLAR